MEPQAAEFTLLEPNTAPSRRTFDQPKITIGRASDCTLPVKDRFLSRHHAEVLLFGDSWVLRDCGSANGTFLNGQRVEVDQPLHPGDRITFGDTQLVFRPTDAQISVRDSQQTSSFSVPFDSAISSKKTLSKQPERLQILNSLAIELLEDRPLSELFEFILDRVMHWLSPSRAAVALLTDDRKSFTTVTLKRRNDSESSELVISRTLLAEVVDEKKVLSFVDVAGSEKLGQALSMIGQSIRSALCAPLLVKDEVVGVLYVDFLLTQAKISEEDISLIAQIARFAAVKWETTRLREESLQKQRMDEELRTAYVIQSRLLPKEPPAVPGYTFAGVNRPCRTVSGDYFDYVRKPDGRIYFVIADVSGKGITAALVMASLATAFNIFARTDPSPAELVRELNATLSHKLAPSKFVTLFAGVLNPVTGEVEYTNAGHVPPLHLTNGGVVALRATDMVVGLFAEASYRNQKLVLEPGDALVTFTDGIIEAENADGVEMGSDGILNLVAGLHRKTPTAIIEEIERAVLNYVGKGAQGDDITILALSRAE